MSKAKMYISITLIVLLLAISGVMIWQLYGEREEQDSSGTLVRFCPKTECAYFPIVEEGGDEML